MVYSSDFYTSRRPAYYKPSTSYSISPIYSSDGYEIPPSYYKVHQVYQTSPFIMTPITSTAKPSSNVLPYNYRYRPTPVPHYHYRNGATIHGVLDKIEHRHRSHPGYDATDEYLNTKSATKFDDVTRSIRAQTAGLLKKIYAPIIRPPKSHSQYNTHTGYMELPIAERIESDAYIEAILRDSQTHHYDTIGKGHLACVTYAGGKAIPRRRPRLSGDAEVDNNIIMLSYYNKTREAAAASSNHPKVKVDTPAKTYNQHTDEIKKTVQFADKKSVELENDRKAAKETSFKEEDQMAEKARREKEEKLAAEEIARKEEEERLAAEEEARRVEEERLAAEEIARKEEEERLAAEEEARRVEEEQLAAEKTKADSEDVSEEESDEEVEQDTKLVTTNVKTHLGSSPSNEISGATTEHHEESYSTLEEVDGGKVSTTVFRRATRTTTTTSSTVVHSGNENDENSGVEIEEVVENEEVSGDEHAVADGQECEDLESSDDEEEIKTEGAETKTEEEYFEEEEESEEEEEEE